MNNPDQNQISIADHSNKSILARACDPTMSKEAAKSIPPLIGNPEYIPATNDVDFIQQLKSRQWSVVFFAPGACRLNAARHPIPGGTEDTIGWTLEQYRELVRKYQGNDVQIVESMEELKTIGLLRAALENARETNPV